MIDSTIRMPHGVLDDPGIASMKLAAICMIRDEADIIVPFLRHLDALFDIVFLLDQRSSDGSGEVMRSACAVRTDWTYYYCDFAGRHHTDVDAICMPLAFARGADAVFFVDSDEFVGVSSRRELDDIVARCNARAALGTFHYRDCVPASFAAWHFDPGSALWIAPKDSGGTRVALPRSVYERYPGLRLQQGSHGVTPPAGLEAIPSIAVGNLLHVPIRSRQQFVQKTFLAAMAYFARGEAMQFEGWHKRWHLEIIAGGELTDDALTAIAAHYGDAGISGHYDDVAGFAVGARSQDLERLGFMLRPLDVPFSDLSLSPPPQPDFVRLMAHCLKEFAVEKVPEGEGVIALERDVLTYRRAPMSGPLPPANLLGRLIARLGLYKSAP